ncbi:MAG TPA: tRNA 2-thiouridine(34) synthase MnmA, partial [Phycisphaerales bacterium]|nr:tRNA 2-thiouridine(34) synthase MnmA [Phycisphaerales bacterium]
MSAPRPKVLVAMSGGVDSSVAAALLLRAGYDVVGCFMRLGSPGETLDELIPDDSGCALRKDGSKVQLKIGHQGCCSIGDAADARLVAAELGIPFYVCNFRKDFGRIIDYFVDEYAQGRTPNPCVRCNDWLKFGKLHEYARQIGAEFVASGHYARVVREGTGGEGIEASMRQGIEAGGGGVYSLRRGIDHAKDQSYVLFGVPRVQLPHMLLPIGGMEKPRVRELAKELGLPVFRKPDSQEICFVPDNDYAGLIERRRSELSREGPIVDTEGNVVGTHGGQHRFTIGQRRGLSVSLGYPIYVVARDAASNTVTVGPRERLLSAGCTVGEANWLSDLPPAQTWSPAWIKYRYNTPAVRGRFRVLEPGVNSGGGTHSGRTGVFEVAFDEPQAAVAAG